MADQIANVTLYVSGHHVSGFRALGPCFILILALVMASISRNIYEKWISISDADLSIGHIEDLKQARDDLWVAAACVDRILDSVTLQRALLEAGLSRTAGAIERSKDAAALAHRTSEEERNNALVGHFWPPRPMHNFVVFVQSSFKG